MTSRGRGLERQPFKIASPCLGLVLSVFARTLDRTSDSMVTPCGLGDFEARDKDGVHVAETQSQAL